MELPHHILTCSFSSSQLLNPRIRVSQTPLLLNPHHPSPPRYHKLTAMHSQSPTTHASSSCVSVENNASSITGECRVGEVKRVTKETKIAVRINLDGSGVADSSTGIPFLDHMLDQLASHGLFDVHVKATGDLHIDDHHTNEDVALAIGTALLQALGDRKGINRFGDFSAPLDEALIHVALDLSGRPHLSCDLCIPTERVGTYDTQLVEHFFQSLVNTSGMTLHIRQTSRGVFFAENQLQLQMDSVLKVMIAGDVIFLFIRELVLGKKGETKEMKIEVAESVKKELDVIKEMMVETNASIDNAVERLTAVIERVASVN